MSSNYTGLPDGGKYLPQFRDFAVGHVREFMLARDRAQKLLGNRQPYILGAGREELVREFLRKVLPSGVGIDSGVVYGFERKQNSKQIDILIWDAVHYPAVFRAESFVVLSPEAVIAAISVKSGADRSDYIQTVDNLSSLVELDTTYRSPGLPPIGKFGIFYDSPKQPASAHAWLAEALRSDLLKRVAEMETIAKRLEAMDPQEPAQEITWYFDRLLPSLFVHLEEQAVSFGRGWGPPNVTVDEARLARFKREPYLYKQESALTSSLEKLVYQLLVLTLRTFDRTGGALLSAWGDFDPVYHFRVGDAGELDEATGKALLTASDVPAA